MALESEWAKEMGWGFSRARTAITREAGGCVTPGATVRALTAWTDGTNWQDGEGETGWSDWPPPELEAIATGQQ